MRTASRTILANLIDELGAKRERLHALQAECDAISLFVLKHGGGEGSQYDALVVKMPKRVMVVKAHRQLRTVPHAD